jgi:hypothetical protein
VAEYEALVLGLRVVKEIGIEEVAVFRDAELIIEQVRNAYRAKQPQLKNYKDEVWDLIDNIKHWKVFEDDLEIKKFLQSVDEFSTLQIDQDPDLESHCHPEVFLNKIANHHIIHLPSNHTPKGLVPLERLFDGNDVLVKSRVSDEDVDTMGFNIGT